MIWLLLVLFPFAAIVGLLVWNFVRIPPEQRARKLFVEIVEYADTHPEAQLAVYQNFPVLHNAVQELDIAYLRLYLARIKHRHP